MITKYEDQNLKLKDNCARLRDGHEVLKDIMVKQYTEYFVANEGLDNEEATIRAHQQWEEDFGVDPEHECSQSLSPVLIAEDPPWKARVSIPYPVADSSWLLRCG